MSLRSTAARRRVATLLAVFVVATAALAIAAEPVSAHGRGRIFFGFDAWVPPPAYAYPPPYYYYPPPVVYAPAPVYGMVGSSQPPSVSPAYRDAQGRICREYQTTVQVDGREQPGYGTACLQTDGSWRLAD
jgi:hypothetical protein